MNFPEDGIYCSEETLARDPAAAEAFVKASLEGWLYAFDHPGEAVDIVLRMMREAHLPANRGHQQWMLARMKDLIMPVGQGYSRGALNKDDFETVSRELVKSGSIPKDIDFNELYRPVLKP